MHTRILIGVYQQAAGYAMKLLLDEQPDMVVTGVVDNSLDLLTQVESARSDVILLQWELFRRLPAGFFTSQSQLESSHVIVYGPRPELAQATLDTDAFVYEGDGPKRLLSTIRSTMLKAKYE